jgi:hypothetical protein
MTERRTTFEKACPGYDPAFERTFTDEVWRAIAVASIVSDRT